MCSNMSLLVNLNRIASNGNEQKIILFLIFNCFRSSTLLQCHCCSLWELTGRELISKPNDKRWYFLIDNFSGGQENYSVFAVAKKEDFLIVRGRVRLCLLCRIKIRKSFCDMTFGNDLSSISSIVNYQLCRRFWKLQYLSC